MLTSRRTWCQTDRGLGGHLAEQQVRVDEGQVAGEDGDAFSEPSAFAVPTCRGVTVPKVAVGCFHTPSPGRAVHHVVVEKGRRMQHLQGRASVDNLRIVRIAAASDEGPVAKRRSEPLATGHHQLSQRGQRLLKVNVNSGPPGPVVVQQAGDSVVHPASDPIQHGCLHLEQRA
jgi:hypothetical protein